METSVIIQILGIVIVLFNTIVSSHNSYNLRRNDEEQKSQWDAIDRRASREDFNQLKGDLESDIKASESRTQVQILQINNTIQTAKAEIMSNIDRLVSALTHK